MASPLSSFFRLVGPTVGPPLLWAIKPRHVTDVGDTSSGAQEEQQAAPRGRYVPKEMLLETTRVGKIKQSPYRHTGPEMPVAVWEAEDGGHVKIRVDIPGANAVEVKGVPHENKITFLGFEESIAMHGIGGPDKFRTYEGLLLFDPVRFPGLDFEFQFYDGVLYLQVRCIMPDSYEISKETANMDKQDLGVTLSANPAEAANDITIASAINPLVIKGEDRHYLHGFTANSFIFAVDMPGIGELDNTDVNVNHDVIRFYAQDTSSLGKYGEGGNEERREYEGYVKVNLKEFEPSKMEHEIVHGVFWIKVPRRVKAQKEVIITLYHGTDIQTLLE
ncbi:hypothetical protein vseg_020318 [Gypsophila vaccaria]